MTLTYPIGRLFGIPLRLHATFLLLPLLMGWAAYGATHDLRSALWSATSILLLFVCVILHELGHCLAARRLGSRVMGITLYPIGGVATMYNLPERPLHEAWVAIAGPLVNVVIAAFLWPLVSPERLSDAWTHLPFAAADLPAALLRANLVLVAFNLLPGFPMDGGRILRATLAAFMGFTRATTVAARIGRLVAILFVIAGLRYSPLLMLIGFMIFVAAGREAELIQTRSRWTGRTVESLMRPASILFTWNTMRDALARMHAGADSDFLVYDANRVVGLMPYRRFAHLLREEPPDARIEYFMDRYFVAVPATADVGQVLFDLGRGPQRLLPVMKGAQGVGVLNLDHLEDATRAPTAMA